jgi:hypothetical protein
MREVRAIKAYTATRNAVNMHESPAKETHVFSPSRAGKTRSLKHDVLIQTWNDQTPFDSFVIAPTYRDLKLLNEMPIVELARSLRLCREHNKDDHLLTLTNGKRIIFRSAEEPDRITGFDASRGWIDEAARCKEESYDNALVRLTLTNGPLKSFTTPKGTSNWMFRRFFGMDAMTQYPMATGPGVWDVGRNRMVRYAITDNPHVTQATIDEYAALMSPLLFRQEILGEWVNLSEHLVYYAFSQDNVKECPYIKGLPVYIGLDYNIDKNGYVAFQQLGNRIIHVFAEGYGAKTTQALAAEIIQRFGAGVTIIDDASGSIRQQGDGRTNRQLLQQSGLHNITSYTSNPNRVDRYANTNAHLLNGLGNRRLFVDTSCKRLVHELNTLCYKKDSDVPDTQGGVAGHITDALGYGVWWISGGAAAWELIAA